MGEFFSQKVCWFNGKDVSLRQIYNISVKMSNLSHNKIMPRLARYFSCLWAALCGRDPHRKELEEMNQRVNQATTDLRHLRQLYLSTLDEWNQTSDLVEHLLKDINNYQKLIETLRSSVHDKQSELAEQQQYFREQLDKVRNYYEKRLAEAQPLNNKDETS